MKRNIVMGILTVMVLFALMAPTVLAKPTADVLTVRPRKQMIDNDGLAVYDLTLTNTAATEQTFEIFTYTPRYFADPGFTHWMEVDSQVMPMVFYWTLDAGEVLEFNLVVDAYSCATQVPDYWCQVHCLGQDIVGWVDTNTMTHVTYPEI